MATKLQVTELDFDDIKNNLKTYMKNQTEFSDYNFEGSGLSTLLDVLAYNTHYLGMNANMAINEAYLDTATLRSSVVSHAKTLGYTPRSARAPVAYVGCHYQQYNSYIYHNRKGYKVYNTGKWYYLRIRSQRHKNNHNTRWYSSFH